MWIEKVFINNLRCFKEKKIFFEKGINIIYGNNASGKTTILEAIYFCLAGKSFRTKDSDAVSFNENFLSIETYGHFNDDDFISYFYMDEIQKRLIVNGKKIHKLSELLEKFSFVLFTPNHINLIKSEPNYRRKFLDMITIQKYPYISKIINNYIKVIQNRNAFLKSGAKKDIIDIYDVEYVKLSAQIIQKRLEIIQELNNNVKVLLNLFVSNVQEVKVVYKNSLNAFDEQSIHKNIKKNMDNDFRFGWTTKGPHRDDFDVLIDGKSAKIYASEGQIKLTALSLILSTTFLLVNPVLLLDDLFSELDKEKILRIMEFSSRFQSFITTTQNDFLNVKGINTIFIEGVK